MSCIKWKAFKFKETEVQRAKLLSLANAQQNKPSSVEAASP